MRRSHLCITVVLVVGLSGPPGQVVAQNPVGRSTPRKPPAEMRLDPFYEKYIDADGIPIVSSRKVPDAALVIAADIAIQMLAGCPKLHKAMVEGKARRAKGD